MFGIGPMELGIIAFIVLLIFGPSAIPRIGKSIGETKKAMRDIREAVEKD